MQDIYRCTCPNCKGKTMIKVTSTQKDEDIFVKCSHCQKIYKVSFKHK